jgi:TPR repeat protein
MGNMIGNSVFRLIAVSVLLLIVAGCSGQSQDDAATYQLGLDAYGKKNYAVALEKFKAVAEHGNAEAQFNLGVMYRQGQGVAQDDKQAVEWWTKAAEQGHTEAQDNLGLRYARGQGVPQDWVQAYKWFTIAGASGNQIAMGNRKVVGLHMPPDKLKEAQALADDWLAKHKK